MSCAPNVENNNAFKRNTNRSIFKDIHYFNILVKYDAANVGHLCCLGIKKKKEFNLINFNISLKIAPV
jgi:hypothetical protein